MDDVATDVTVNEEVVVNFEQIEDTSSVPARVVAVNGRDVRLEFMPTSLEEERTIVSAVFGRADAWLNWDDRPPDTVGKSLVDLSGAIRGLAGMAFRNLRRPRPSTQQPLPAPSRPT